MLFWLSFVPTTVLLASSMAQNIPTKGLFIDNMDPAAAWAASVVEACNASTTYAIACTSAPLNAECSVGAKPITITEGPSGYAATTSAIYSETSVTITESCSFNKSATSASCIQTIDAGGFGQRNVFTKSFNLTGQYYHNYSVAVTAGASKLEGDTCSTSGSPAARSGMVTILCSSLMVMISLCSLIAL